MITRYEIHLKSGEILEYKENSAIPYPHRLCERFRNAVQGEVLFIGHKLIIPAENISFLQIIENEGD